MKDQRNEEKQDKAAESEEEQSELSTEQLEEASGGGLSSLQYSSKTILRDASEAIIWVPCKPDEDELGTDELSDFDGQTR